MTDFKKVTANLAYFVGGLILGILACAWGPLIGMIIAVIAPILVEALCGYWKKFWTPAFSNIAFGVLGGGIAFLIILYCKFVFNIVG